MDVTGAVQAIVAEVGTSVLVVHQSNGTCALRHQESTFKGTALIETEGAMYGDVRVRSSSSYRDEAMKRAFFELLSEG